MKVLLIGGTGVISQAVTKLVSQNENTELFLINRSGEYKFDFKNRITFLKGNIRNKNEIKSLLKKFEFDVVIDFLCYNEEHAVLDFELFNKKTKQFIFISSASCYQKPYSFPFQTESTPLHNPYWDYSQNKIKCENYFMNKYVTEGFPITIIRPAHTYGKDKIVMPVSGGSTFTYIDMILKGEPVVTFGDGLTLWTVTHNSDFAKGLVGLIGNNLAIGHSFHITNDIPLTWNQIINTLGDVLNKEVNILNIPTDFIYKELPEYKGPFLGDKCYCNIFDNSKIKTFVPNFVATKSYKDGVQEVVDYIYKNKELQVISSDYVTKIKNLTTKYNSGGN